MAKKEEIEKHKAGKLRAAVRVSLWGSLAAVSLMMVFTLQAFEIPSGSMEDTLLVGDHIFVNRAPSSPATRWLAPLLPHSEIRRGDVVVFLSPEQPGLYVVRRLIGVPGDRLHLRDGVLYRNGVKQDEPYVRHDSAYVNPYSDNFPAIPPSEMFGVRNRVWANSLPRYVEGEDLVVPPNSYFGMGDNREMSYDSRFTGFFPRVNVVGRPLFIYWSFATPRDQYEKRSIADRLSFTVHAVVHFFDETRWSRTFKVVK